jgi:hypothetical protein
VSFYVYLVRRVCAIVTVIAVELKCWFRSEIVVRHVADLDHKI